MECGELDKTKLWLFNYRSIILRYFPASELDLPGFKNLEGLRNIFYEFKMQRNYNSLVALNLISGQRSSVSCKLTRLLAT
jgi:hypothetical protein